MSEWQDISTAPMDEWLLVFGEPYDDGGCPYGVAKATIIVEEWWERTSPTKQELRSRERIEWDGGDLIPTKWKPLPAAPVTEDRRP